jgi:hypothetical protein
LICLEEKEEGGRGCDDLDCFDCDVKRVHDEFQIMSRIIHYLKKNQSIFFLSGRGMERDN